MHNRFTGLQFIIALFFGILGVILLTGYFFSPDLHFSINLYSGICFVLFALVLGFVGGDDKEDVTG